MKNPRCSGGVIKGQRRPMSLATAEPALGVERQSRPPGLNKRAIPCKALRGSHRCSITSHMTTASKKTGGEIGLFHGDRPEAVF